MVDLIEIKAELARRKHLKFMEFCWLKRGKFFIGLHTEAICSRIDQAIADFKKGKSTYLMIKCAHRHGKSDILSRYLPPHFLGEFPEEEIIVAAHSDNLAFSFSRFARKIMRSEKYGILYPNIRLSKGEQSVATWGIEGHHGQCVWAGIRGSIIGKGASLALGDDFIKGRLQAESETIRQQIWEGFSETLMTRLAPVHIVIILATPWHVDDIFGRIAECKRKDFNFPNFEEMKFPAKSDRYPKKYLFLEKYSEEWYETEFAALGGENSYGAAGLMWCEPVPKGSNIIPCDKIKYIDADEVPKDIVFTRGWDLASTAKERMKDDPDYTVGIKLGVSWQPTAIEGEFLPIFYITDMVRGQWEPSKRDAIIKQVAIADGYITQGIEGFGGYRDSYKIISNVLSGIRVIKKCNPLGSKPAKWDALSPAFTAGNVYLKRAPWNSDFIAEMSLIPGAKHDDIADALLVAFHCHVPRGRLLFMQMDYESQISINFSSLPPSNMLFISQWVQEDLKTAVIMGLWNMEQGSLYIYGEADFDNPAPETVLPFVIQNIKKYSQNSVTGLSNFQWFGNDLMFSENKNIERTIGNLKNLYQKYDINVQKNRFYNELGAIFYVNRLIFRKKLFIDPNTCPVLLSEMQDWAVEKGKPAEGHIFCHALCYVMTALHETGVMKEEEPNINYYSQERMEHIAALKRDKDMALAVSQKNDWMKF